MPFYSSLPVFRRLRGLARAGVYVLLLLAVRLVQAQGAHYSYDPSGNTLARATATAGPPVIVGQPQPQIVAPGELASFSVSAANPTGCAYQWLFNGTNVSGQTRDALLLVNVSTNNQGPYSVIVTNLAGGATSVVAQLYIDSNRNGLPDSWELAYFGNLSQNALGDADGDGISNLQEYSDGTNPTNRSSFRSHLTLFNPGGSVTVTPAQPSYALTDTVALAAAPISPNAFYGWTGDLVTRSNPAALLMNTNKTVRACFLCQPAVSGLVGWWRGETDASDFVGGHHGTFYSGTNVVAPSVSATGMVGSAFALYGTNYIQVADSGGLRPGQLTLEAWVFPTVQAGYQTVMARGSAVNDDDSYYLGINNGVPHFWTKNNGSMSVLTGGGAPLNQWTHLAATFDGSSKRLYVNGLLVGLQTGFGPLTYDLSGPVTLGADWAFNVAGAVFNGLLDEVTLFNRALSPAEITGLFIANCAGKCTSRPIFISSPQFTTATQGIAYTQQVATILGTAPIAFSLSAGTLPAGLTLSALGSVSGIPTVPGSNVFAVVATDAAGLSTELICGLNVLAAPSAPTAPAMPAGLVSWWRAENNALDAVGTNNGALSNGVSFVAGEVGQAFRFAGANQEVKVPASPSLNVGPGSGFSLEAWIKPADLLAQYPLMEWNDGSTLGSHFWINVPFSPGGQGSIFANLRDTNGSDHSVSSPAGLLSTSVWQHVALTYDHNSGAAQLFFNGSAVASVNLGIFVPRTTADLHLGLRPGAPPYPGLLDEPALYNRPLTGAEVAAIYNAGPLGKVSNGPYINTPGALPDGVVGQGYTQAITSVRGTLPITYGLAGGGLPGGLTLNSSGLLSGIPGTAGAFSFAARATDGAALSNTQFFSLQIYGQVPPPPGIVGWWRGESNAVDSVGTNNGTLRNGAGFNTGKVGQAFALDGASQSVDIPDAPALRPASLTLETWAFYTAAGTRVLLGKPLGGANIDSYQIYISGGALGAFVGDAASVGTQLSFPFSPMLGRWYHTAYTFDDNTKQQALYLDGSLVASGVVNKTIGYDAQPLLLGRDTENGGPNYFFSGRLDETAIYNRALGSNEIAALANAGPGGKTTTGPAFGTPPALPNAVVSTGYTQTLALARGVASSFVLVSGALPPGLNLSPSGVLSGLPTTTGSYNFVIRATDVSSLTADQGFSVRVLPRVSPPAGLAGWWRAENNTHDSAGGNDGFLVNAATFAAGRVGQAFSLSGAGDAIEIEDAPGLRPASVTLEAWVLFFSGGAQTIMGKPVGGGTADSYILWLENGNLNGAIGDLTGAGGTVSMPFAPVIGQWYHLAFTFDDATKQEVLYLNGAPVAFGIANLAIGYDTHPLFLGADLNNGGVNLFLQGRIDEATLYSRALTGGEIAAIYSADAAGKTAAGPYIDTPPVLPDGAIGVGYTQMVTSVRGTPSVQYSLIGGALPGGLGFSGQGLLSGIPTNSGSFSFTVRATDAGGLFGDQAFSLRIAAPVPPVAGLVSWWRAENNALDAVGTNHGAALNGASYAVGKVGQGFVLDGLNDCIQIPDSPGLRPVSFTLETWVRFDANTGIRVFFAKPLGGGSLDSFALWLENGNLRAVVSDASGSGPALSVPFTPTLEQWYHIAYAYDGRTWQQALYVNDTLVASGVSDRSVVYDSQPLLLGCDSDNGNHAWFLQGRMDEAALYNRALTATEIASLYYAGAAGKSLAGPYFTTLPFLPDAIINQPYSQPLATARGTLPVTYTLVSGGLPPGLSFNSSGLVSGTPTNTGSYGFTARATDGTGLFAEQAYTLSVFAPTPLPAGLLGWWRGESNTVDQLGLHNGTLQGNATYGPGRVGAAFSLDGVNSFVNLGTWSAGSNWTMEAWINPSARLGGRHTVFGSLNNCLDWGLEMTDGQIGAQLRPPGGCTVFLGSGVGASLNFWHHLAATCDGTNAAIYVDGVKLGTALVDTNYQGDASGLRIGSSVCCGEYFAGLVDEVAVYNRPLSASEVAGIYNAGPAGKISLPPLVLRPVMVGGSLLLSFDARVGVTYTVQSETALSPASWLPLTNITALTTPVTLTVPITNGPQRFYRLVTSGN